MATNPLALLWIGLVDIFRYETVTDPITKQSTQQETAIVLNEPCRISYKKEQATNIRNGAAVISQSITLFIRPDLVIPAGSVIVATQHGRTVKYKGSSTAAVYTNHQEIILDLYEQEA